MPRTAAPRPRLRLADGVGTAFAGLTGHRLRAVLAALGISIGVAAIVTVIGLSASSRANLLAEFDRIGSNLLTATPAPSATSRVARLPDTAPVSVAGIDGVSAVASQARITGATVRRSPFVPPEDTSGVAVVAADPQLSETLGAELAAGRFLDAASAATPVAVLGAVAARRLDVRAGSQVYLGERWFTVIGVMRPVLLDGQLDASALVGYPFARSELIEDLPPTKLFVRTADERIDEIRVLLGPTANAQSPEAVLVTRPSDALRARAAAKATFNGLFIGLGAVALLIGGVGVANVMVISVLERRAEIGLRRALGAVRLHIAGQFLVEALILSTLGGLAGTALGVGTIAVVAAVRDWAPVIPVVAVAASVGASVLVGILAGAYPAVRASRLAPAEALRSV